MFDARTSAGGVHSATLVYDNLVAMLLRPDLQGDQFDVERLHRASVCLVIFYIVQFVACHETWVGTRFECIRVAGSRGRDATFSIRRNCFL